ERETGDRWQRAARVVGVRMSGISHARLQLLQKRIGRVLVVRERDERATLHSGKVFRCKARMEYRVSEDLPGALEVAARAAERKDRVVVVDAEAQARARPRQLASHHSEREFLAGLGRD